MPQDDIEAKLKERLRQAETRLRAVFEKLPTGLLVLEPDGTIVFSNSKANQLLSRPAAVLKGTNVCVHLRRAEYNTFEVIQNHLRLNSKPLELEALRGEDVLPLPVELSLADFDIDGRSAYLASFTDISERKRFEKLKNDLIAMVSHDLATPLSSIQLTLNLLNMTAADSLNEKLAEQVQRAERSAGQLVKLISDLLTVERLESGHIDMLPRATSLEMLVDDAIELVQDKAEDQAISIKRRVERIDFIADKDRLQQVLVNLLSNALKYSPSKDTVSVDAGMQDGCVRVSVKDNGRGVPLEAQSRIFERFQQVELNDARQMGGRGLGLAICKAVVSAHGGAIGVTSEPGKGSEFWFIVPLTQSTSGDA